MTELTLDELAQRCGYFTDEPFYYTCLHPDCEDGEEFNGKWYGKCFSFSCPLAYKRDDEDYGFDGDTIMVMIVDGER